MSAKRLPLPPVEYLRECFAYNPVSGKVTWQHRPERHFGSAGIAAQRNALAGRAVCHIGAAGYIRVKLDRTTYLLHRIIWAIHSGKFDEELEIDHINGNRLDNRFDNLRLATHTENNRNRSVNSNNKLGIRGVYWHATAQKYYAYVGFNGRREHLGSFDSVATAEQVVKAARASRHGAFAK